MSRSFLCPRKKERAIHSVHCVARKLFPFRRCCCDPITIGLPEHTLGSGQGSNVSGLGTDIVDNGSLEPGDDKVSSLIVDLLLDTEDTGVLDSTVTSVN